MRMRWVKCAERLPDREGTYTVRMRSRHIQTAVFHPMRLVHGTKYIVPLTSYWETAGLYSSMVMEWQEEDEDEQRRNQD